MVVFDFSQIFFLEGGHFYSGGFHFYSGGFLDFSRFFFYSGGFLVGWFQNPLGEP